DTATDSTQPPVWEPALPVAELPAADSTALPQLEDVKPATANSEIISPAPTDDLYESKTLPAPLPSAADDFTANSSHVDTLPGADDTADFAPEALPAAPEETEADEHNSDSAPAPAMNMFELLRAEAASDANASASAEPDVHDSALDQPEATEPDCEVGLPAEQCDDSFAVEDEVDETRITWMSGPSWRPRPPADLDDDPREVDAAAGDDFEEEFERQSAVPPFANPVVEIAEESAVLVEVVEDEEASVDEHSVAELLTDRAPAASAVTIPTDREPIDELRDQITADLKSGQARTIALVAVEGSANRSGTVARLAQSFARLGHGSVLAVDATFGSSQLASDLGAKSTPGLAEWLDRTGNAHAEPLRPAATCFAGVEFLGSGVGANPNLALGDARWLQFDSACRASHRWTLIDAGEASAVGATYASLCDAAYLLVCLQETPRQAAVAAIARLREAGVCLHGCLVIGDEQSLADASGWTIVDA
ncbi:MAG: hypothetical protein KDA42_15985, partial [Planctomycetales bacterium]|nr:hypothetical protein [Planctomycetales bacterium]